MRKSATLLFAALCLCALLTTTVWAQGQEPAQAQAKESAQSWSGTLADASCKQSTPSQACKATATTSNFGIDTSDGKFYKFDSKGNDLAKAEMGKAPAGTPTTYSVTGKLQGETIAVTSLSAR
jgi:hypothetical protein